MILLQLAGMYQAIANGGVRVAPTIIAGTTVDGVHDAQRRPARRPRR